MVIIYPLKMVIDKSNGLDIFSIFFHFSWIGKDGHVLIAQKWKSKLVIFGIEANRMRNFLKLIGIVIVIIAILCAFDLISYQQVFDILS